MHIVQITIQIVIVGALAVAFVIGAIAAIKGHGVMPMSKRKKRSRWFPMLMLCFGVFFIAASLDEKFHGVEGHVSRGAFVSWWQSLAVGIVAVAGSVYVLTRTASAAKSEDEKA